MALFLALEPLAAMILCTRCAPGIVLVHLCASHLHPAHREAHLQYGQFARRTPLAAFLTQICGESNATIFREAKAAGVARATFISVMDYKVPGRRPKQNSAAFALFTFTED